MLLAEITSHLNLLLILFPISTDMAFKDGIRELRNLSFLVCFGFKSNICLLPKNFITREIYNMDS